MNNYDQKLLQNANLLRKQGRYAEAAAAYESALSEQPQLSDEWYNYALLLSEMRSFRKSLDAYQQALAHGISRPEEALLNRGVIYTQHLRQDDLAEKEFKAALELSPNFAPALINLGNIEEERGNRDGALDYFQKVLDHDPQNYSALSRSANVQPTKAIDAPIIGKLKDAISQPSATATDRADLGFALGKVLNDAGAFDEAFEAYAAANRNSREEAGAKFVPYNRAGMEQFVSNLISLFRERRPGISMPGVAAPMIFICGMFRSGSTLTEQVLGSHPRVTAGGELDLLPRLVKANLSPFPEALTRVDEAKLKQIALRYLNGLSTLFPDADFVTDKRPDNFLYIGLIKELFPNAKIINTMRHPLDNGLSIYFLHLWQNMSYALDLSDIGHYYSQYRRLMSHWNTLYGEDILNFDYDQFVRDPKPATEKLLEFCGLEWDDACLSFHQSKNTVRTASRWQVRQPLYDRSSGRWRNYRKHIQPLVEQLGDLLPKDQRAGD